MVRAKVTRWLGFKLGNLHGTSTSRCDAPAEGHEVPEISPEVSTEVLCTAGQGSVNYPNSFVVALPVGVSKQAVK